MQMRRAVCYLQIGGEGTQHANEGAGPVIQTRRRGARWDWARRGEGAGHANTVSPRGGRGCMQIRGRGVAGEAEPGMQMRQQAGACREARTEGRGYARGRGRAGGGGAWLCKRSLGAQEDAGRGGGAEGGASRRRGGAIQHGGGGAMQMRPPHLPSPSWESFDPAARR